ncbi:uncharacterized protein LOC132714122 [Ruditapes philippinarum]|uniref:uncharacterized protein LOC132714122 n=1 Tax=Ruditapes philippinarum TaxID=129788 RepID=UPI00295B06F0|nr:uncharacterized protein LOC132714122 [Ruditapes philippinarum]
MSLMRWLDKTKHGLMLLLFVFSIGLYYLLFWCRFNISLQRKEQIPNIDNFKVKDNRNVNLQLKNDMEAYIQDKIKQIQNPTSCELSSKVVCELPPAGFGSQVHLLTICFTIGFMTKRVVIFKKGRSKYNKTGWDELFLPLSSTCSTHMNSTVHQVLSNAIFKQLLFFSFFSCVLC